MSEPVPAYRADDVRAAERPLLDAGVPLMARASTALATVLRERLLDEPGPVLVLAGSGDNGGDALFAAAQLAADGADVDILRTADRVHHAALAAALEAGCRELDLADLFARPYALVVDGILGIGASGEALRGRAREVVTALLPSVTTPGPPFAIAVDLPSGLDPDAGTAADDVVLPASVTVTFGALKAGLVQGDGPRLAGRVVLADIGMRDALSAATPVAEASVADVVTAAES